VAITLATITLPADLEWTDEFDWLPTSQQVDIAMSGALIVEESAQLAGRPITLEGRLDGSVGFALIPRSTVSALVALASTPRATPMSLLLEDGRTFDVLFRHGQDGPAVEAHAMKHIAPHVDDDLYTITLRLMQV
jgi:hypothetical protein